MTSHIKPIVIVLGAILLVSGGQTYAQPLLREGDQEAGPEAGPDAETVRRRALARQKAELEEERQLKLQQELMRMRGEQMLAEQAEIKRRDTRMRYALIIAVAVIATTLVIAYVRSHAAVSKGERPGASP